MKKEEETKTNNDDDDDDDDDFGDMSFKVDNTVVTGETSEAVSKTGFYSTAGDQPKNTYTRVLLSA